MVLLVMNVVLRGIIKSLRTNRRLSWRRRGSRRCLQGFLHLAAMTLELARGRKFSKLMTNHIFHNMHGYMSLTVMHSKRIANHSRRYGGRTKPGLNHGSVSRFELSKLL